MDAATGEQQWTLETSNLVQSSPTIVDGTVFFGGGYDLLLHAVDAGVPGSSEGSRVMLGTLGHHGDGRHTNQSINDPPTASVSVTPNAPRAGESVTFDAGSSSDPDGSISSYEWSINGTTKTGETVEHTFESPGEYTVELTVTDDLDETNSTTESILINQSPTAEFTVSQSSAEVGESVTFDGSNSSDPDGSISSFEWAINGTNKTGENVEYTFENPGEYTVELTVTDEDGATATETRTVEVLGQETPESQEGGNVQQTTEDTDESGGIPVLNRFGNDGESIGLSVGALGVLSGGGYLAYRQKSDDESSDQRDIYIEKTKTKTYPGNSVCCLCGPTDWTI